MLLGTSLVVQWLRIYLAMQGIKANPGQGTKIPCASQLGKKKKKELEIKKLQANKSTRRDSFTGQFYQTYKEELMPILLKVFQKIEEEGTLPNLFFDVILP